jgi:hypothetical protein
MAVRRCRDRGNAAIIYMVELALIDVARRAKWNVWHFSKLKPREIAVPASRAEVQTLIGLPGVWVCKPLTHRLVADSALRHETENRC